MAPALKPPTTAIIADSGEEHKKEQECLDDIDRVKASKDEPVKKD